MPVVTSGVPAQSAPLLEGAVIAAGPAGYCVDARASRPRDGFAMLAACSSVSGDNAGAVPRLNGILTVQADTSGTGFVAGSEDSLAAFLKTKSGARMLSNAVEVMEIKSEPAAVSVYFRDLSDDRLPNTQVETWRVFTDILGHGVTISLRGLAKAPLSQTEGMRLLQGALGTMRAANNTST